MMTKLMKKFVCLTCSVVLIGACGNTIKDSNMDNGTKPTSTTIPSVTYNALYVVNGGDNSISVIDTTKNEVAATITIKNATYPHHVNFSADKSLFIVAAPGTDLSGGHGGGHGAMAMKGALLVIDAKTGETKASRTLDTMNHNGIFSPDGKEIWTSQMMQPGSVLILDGQTLATKQEIAVGDMPAEITFSPDGKYAFVANGMSNSVSVIDVASKTVVKAISVDEDPVGAWAGKNGLMYVDCEEAKTLIALDPRTLQSKHKYALGFMPGMAAISPNGELWVTDAEGGKVAFYMDDMDMKMGELQTGSGAHGIAFSEDGKNAYISNQGANSITVIEVSSHKLIKNIIVGKKPNGLGFRSL